MLKKYLKIITILLIALFFLGSYFIFSNNEFSKKLKDKLPLVLKKNLKDYIFFIPIKIREFKNLNLKVQNLDLQTRELKRKVDVLNSKINSGTTKELILTDNSSNEYLLKKIFLDYSLDKSSKKMEKKNGYLEIDSLTNKSGVIENYDFPKFHFSDSTYIYGNDNAIILNLHPMTINYFDEIAIDNLVFNGSLSVKNAFESLAGDMILNKSTGINFISLTAS